MHEISENGLTITFTQKNYLCIVTEPIALLSLRMRTSKGIFSCISWKLQRKDIYVPKTLSIMSQHQKSSSSWEPGHMDSHMNSTTVAAQAELAVSTEEERDVY